MKKISVKKSIITLLAGSACALCAIGVSLPTETASAEASAAAFTGWESGASVRIDTSDAGTSGIRFSLNFNEELYNALVSSETKELNTGAAMGMFILPAKLYTNSEWSMSEYITEVKTVTGLTEAHFSNSFAASNMIKTKDGYQVRGAMYGISDAKREYHAVAYYEVDGVRTYYETLSDTRNVKYVADRALTDVQYEYTDAQTGVLTSFVSSALGQNVTIDALQETSSYAFGISDKDATYTVEDESVLSIHNGVVTAKKNGVSAVTLSAYGGALKHTVNVTVNTVSKLAIQKGGEFDSNIDATIYSLRHADMREAINGAETPVRYAETSGDSKPVGFALTDGVLSVSESTAGNYATWGNSYMIIKLDGQTLEAGQEYGLTLGMTSTITDPKLYQVGVMSDNEEGAPATIRSIKIFDTAATNIANANGLKLLNGTNQTSFFNGNAIIRFTVPTGEDLTNAYVLIRSQSMQAFHFSVNSLRFGKVSTSVAASSTFTATKGGEATPINITYYSLTDAAVSATKNVYNNAYKSGSATTYLMENVGGGATFLAENATASKYSYAMIKFDLGKATLAANTKYQVKFNSTWLSTVSSSDADAFRTMVITESLTTETTWQIYDMSVNQGMKHTSYDALFGASGQYVNFTTGDNGAVSTFYIMVRSQSIGTMYFDISNVTLKVVQ